MKTWDNYWKTYQLSKAEEWLVLERDKILNKYLDQIKSSPKKTIEIGCGYGSNIRLLKNKRNDLECFALDNSRVAIDALKNVIPQSFLADGRVTPFEDKKFDLIYSAGLMEHFPNEKPFLEEMKRILTDNGFLIIFVPAKYSLWKLYQLLHFGHWQHGYEKSYTQKSLQSLLAENGFKIIGVFGLDPFSLNGFIMKLLNIKYSPIIKKSWLKSGYTELCLVAQK